MRRSAPGLLAALLALSGAAQPAAATPPLRRQAPTSPDRLRLALRFDEALARFEVEQRSEHDEAPRAGARTLRLQVHAAASAGPALGLRVHDVRCAPVPCRLGEVDADWGLVTLRFQRPWPAREPLRLHARFEGKLPRLASRGQGPQPGADPMAMLGGLLALARGAEGGPPGHGLVGRDEAVASLPWPHLLPVRGAPVQGPRFGDLGPAGLLDADVTVRLPEGVRLVATGTQTSGASPAEVRVRARAVRGFALLLSRRWRRRCESLHTLGRRRHGTAAVRQPVRVCVWTVRIPEARAALMLQTALSALQLFEQRFGTYPYPELDVVEQRLSGGAGGVEHSGLVTVAPFPMPAGPGAPPMIAALADAMARFVTVHEVAHQWWFGLVGSDARQQPVLDEALAQWSSLLYFREREGEQGYLRERDRMVLSSWWAWRLGGGPDGAAARPVAAFDRMEAYAAIVYGKAPMLYDALQREPLGGETLLRRLRRYAERHAWREARIEDLAAALTEGLPPRRAERVRALLRRWWHEAHGEEDLGPATVERMLGPWLRSLESTRRRSRRGPPVELPAGRGGSRRARRPRPDPLDTAGTLRRALEALQGM